MRLVLAEKPSVAAEIAKALATTGERFTRTPWGYESDRTLITSALGHLLAELEPERYDERFKTWCLEDLPIIPDVFRYRPRDTKAAELLKTLKSLADRPAVSILVNACDSGREGELIAKLAFDAIKTTKPIQRAWFSSLTPDAIVAAFANLRPDAEMQPLEAAARCRSEADWLVGINATRAATVRLGRRTLISLGRVQTPTLALVVERDLAIERFVVTDFFQVRGRFAVAAGELEAWWFDATGPDPLDRLDDWLAADDIVRRCDNRPATVTAVETKPETQAPPRLFDLTSLQQEANRRYGYTATRTLAAAQALYETHKYLTYPRTSSQFLTTDMAAGVPGLVARVGAADPALTTYAAALRTPDVARVVNDAKVTDHHAIIPTDAAHDLSALAADERRIYDLVARRFLAALSAPAKLDRTTVVVTVDADEHPETFRARGSVVLDAAWRAVYPGPGITAQGTSKAAVDDPAGDDPDAETADPTETDVLCPAVTGEAARTLEVEVVTRHTTPPKPFTDATLLGAMSTAGRLVDDDELADAMKDSGLGTPATRAAIIERLIKVEYLDRKGKALRATTKGRAVIEILGDHPLTSPVLTGGWEQRLAVMERCDPADAAELRAAFNADVRAFTGDVVTFVESLDATGFSTANVLGPCPVPGCAGSIVERSKSWSCDSWKSKDQPGCGYAIWKTESGKRVSEAAARKRLAEPYTAPVKAERIEVAPCPSPGCGGTILARAKSWSCDSWRPNDPGCGFVIWRTRRDGTEVTDDDARARIATGNSDAKATRETLGPCPVPRCKGQIVERERSFGCNSWRGKDRPGCGLTVWKTDKAGNVVATRDNLAELLPTAVENRKRR